MSIKGIQHQASGSEDPKEYCLRTLGMSVLPVRAAGRLSPGESRLVRQGIKGTEEIQDAS